MGFKYCYLASSYLTRLGGGVIVCRLCRRDLNEYMTDFYLVWVWYFGRVFFIGFFLVLVIFCFNGFYFFSYNFCKSLEKCGVLRKIRF